jgi:hypothetical protein
MVPALLLLGLLMSHLTQSQTPVPFTTVAEGQESNIDDARQAVVNSEQEWKALWKIHAADKPLPAIDFSTTSVIAVFLGSRPTGGYRVAVTAVDQQGDTIVVSWRETRPPAGLIVTQVLTFPYHIVSIAKTTAAVKFRKE